MTFSYVYVFFFFLYNVGTAFAVEDKLSVRMVDFLFDDIFTLEKVDPDGKKFDKGLSEYLLPSYDCRKT